MSSTRLVRKSGAHFEDWIVNDVTLTGEGYTLVGRQVSVHDGRLDLVGVETGTPSKRSVPPPRKWARTRPNEALDDRLDEIERFLTEYFPARDG